MTLRARGTVIDRDGFNDQLADAARAMGEQHGAPPTLQRVVDICIEALDHCDVAGISLFDGDRVRTLVASSDELRVIDDLQFQLREGPCYDALRIEQTVTANNLADDSRWPRWGPIIAQQLDVFASMSFRLFTDERSLGALNTYSRTPAGFDHHDLAQGYVVAAHAASTLISNRRETELNRALDSRTVIGQATGILMERFALDSASGFNVLRSLSSRHNIKIIDLARNLVDHNQLPDNGTKNGPSPQPRPPRPPNVTPSDETL